MGVLKKIILAMALLIGFVFIFAWFLPSRYNYNWQAEINAPIQKVRGTIIDFNTWDKWDIWHSHDPQAVFTIAGEPGKAGHQLAWQGPILGDGSFSILANNTSEPVRMTMQVKEPSYIRIDFTYELTPLSSNRTKLVWYVSGDLVYPLGRIAGLFFKSLIEPDFTRSLQGLKTYLEK